MKYFKRAVLFGSLTRGGHLQVFDVVARVTEDGADIETGIQIHNIQETSKQPWRQEVIRTMPSGQERSYFTLKVALKDFETRWEGRFHDDTSAPDNV